MPKSSFRSPAPPSRLLRASKEGGGHFRQLLKRPEYASPQAILAQRRRVLDALLRGCVNCRMHRSTKKNLFCQLVPVKAAPEKETQRPLPSFPSFHLKGINEHHRDSHAITRYPASSPKSGRLGL